MARNRLLKKDLFGEVRHISAENGDKIVRDAAVARPWLRWLARRLLRREVRVLAALDGLEAVPALLDFDRDRLVRSYVAGAPMHEARPTDPVFHRRLMRALRRMHRACVAHNDLAKEPNILVAAGDRPVFIDFQLALFAPRRGRLFRVLAYDDIRHVLKHKRTYCPAALTTRERRVLDTPALPSRLWMKTGKPVYLFITRRLLGWADREGAADRGRPE